MIMGHQFEVLENLIKALSVYLNTIYIRISFPCIITFEMKIWEPCVGLL